MTAATIVLPLIDLYDIVTAQTDFLGDLPTYHDATDAVVAGVVDYYIFVAEDLAEMTFADTAKSAATLRLFERAWAEIERKERASREEDRPYTPEYSTYRNAN